MFNWGSDFKPASTSNTTSTAGKSTTTATADADDADEDDDDDDDEEEGDEGGAKASSKTLRSRQKESLRRREEQAIREREAAIEKGQLVPERPEDFERLLLGEPSSSFLWVQFMAHYLLQADIEAARGVAERALRTIGFREEGEKLNVWMAMLNLEHKYGSMQTLEAVFARAVAESQGKVIHLNLAEVYEQAGDTVGAGKLFDKALKKYKYSKKVWMAYQHFKLRQGDHEAAKYVHTYIILTVIPLDIRSLTYCLCLCAVCKHHVLLVMPVVPMFRFTAMFESASL
jgi:rRNA biogenesis protein RRP5